MTSQDPLLLGIDIGTTNLKTLIFDNAGHVVAYTSAPTPTHYPRAGWAYYEPEEIWQRVLDLIRAAVAQVERPQAITGIACTSVGESGVLIDATGHPLCDAIAWFDRRTEPQAAYLLAHIGREAIFKASGLDVYPIYGLCKILWLRDNHPDVLARAAHWLNMADFIAYKLCGIAATDYSLASRTLALDLRCLCWNDALLQEVGIRPSLPAPLQPSGTRLGAVLPEVARATGLPESAQVATGGHDHICAALALGVVRPSDVLDSMGTAEALFMPLSHVLDDIALAQMGYAQGVHVSGGYYILGGQFASGAAVEWFKQMLGGSADYHTLIEEAKRVLPGSAGVVFLPHLRSANTPHNDPFAMGAFLGLTTDVQRGHLFRALLEGIAMEMRSVLLPLLALQQQPLEHIRATGGGTRNALLMQIKADVFNRRIEVIDMDEGAALGAAMLAGIAVGVYSSIEEAVRLVAAAYPSTIVSPSEDAAFYNDLYSEVYQHIYAALRPINHALHRLLNKGVG
ncbi:MAG: FGGY family carbohydrate kinase [Anaerolineae bacterium]|nr:FGGY family carbohydrate kinase [Candidatus Roseilinea sp.]MDW8451797.1 FGGY family carbohydrate kinase [Anaerolineae bacterium]